MGNPLGTLKEHIGKGKKKSLSHSTPKTQKEKKSPSPPPKCMLSLLIVYLKFLFPKLFITIFDPANTVGRYLFPKRVSTPIVIKKMT
jgi:hypothetical protein